MTVETVEIGVTVTVATKVTVGTVETGVTVETVETGVKERQE